MAKNIVWILGRMAAAAFLSFCAWALLPKKAEEVGLVVSLGISIFIAFVLVGYSISVGDQNDDLKRKLEDAGWCRQGDDEVIEGLVREKETLKGRLASVESELDETRERLFHVVQEGREPFESSTLCEPETVGLGGSSEEPPGLLAD